MRVLNRCAALALAAGFTFAAGCADSPLAPADDGLLVAQFGKPDGGDKGGGKDDAGPDSGPILLQWKNPIAETIVTSTECSSDGCSLKIDELKVNVSVPANALSEPTTITMRALAGTDVNFEFGPHGLQFLKPISVSVTLSETSADGMKNGRYSALYWTHDEGFIETLPAELKSAGGDGKKILFYPIHFSGYALAM